MNRHDWERLQDRYFDERDRRQTEKEIIGGLEDGLLRLLFRPWVWIIILFGVILFMVIQVIQLFWMWLVSIGIVIACVKICKNINNKVEQPRNKIFATIGISAVLIISVLSIARTPSQNRQPPSTQAITEATRVMLVNADALNVRRGPSANYAVVGSLPRNTRVHVIDDSGQWHRIRSGNIEGFANSTFLVADARAFFASGVAHFNRNDFDNAIADFTQVIQLEPNNAHAFLNRSSAHIHLIRLGTGGDWNQIIADLEAVLRINPNHVEAREILELARQYQGR